MCIPNEESPVTCNAPIFQDLDGFFISLLSAMWLNSDLSQGMILISITKLVWLWDGGNIRNRGHK